MSRIRAGLVGVMSLWLRLPMAVRALAPIGVMATLWWLSSRVGERRPPDPVRETLANFAHVVAYFGLAGAWLLTFVSADGVRAGLVRRASIVWAVGLSSLYGVVDELHQLYVPGRAFSVLDMLSDAFGSMMAAAFVVWIATGSRRLLGVVLLFALLGMASALAGTLLE